jgi:hypothetical protein
LGGGTSDGFAISVRCTVAGQDLGGSKDRVAQGVIEADAADMPREDLAITSNAPVCDPATLFVAPKKRSAKQPVARDRIGRAIEAIRRRSAKSTAASDNSLSMARSGSAIDIASDAAAALKEPII